MTPQLFISGLGSSSNVCNHFFVYDDSGKITDYYVQGILADSSLCIHYQFVYALDLLQKVKTTAEAWDESRNV